MRRLTLIAVLTLLSLQWGDAITPIPEGQEYVYSYTGVVRAKNSGSDVYASQWNMAGKLIMQSNGDDIVMKYDDIISSIFNGDLKNLKNAEEKIIPEEAHKLYLPFVVHYHKNGSALSLSHQPDDALWSLNMKRAIASIIQLDTENTDHLHEKKFYEESIYGNCEAEYTVEKHDTDKTVSKTINDGLCLDVLERSWSSSTQAPAMPKGFRPITTNIVRTYRFVQNDDTYLLKHVESNSNITYLNMHCERSSLQLVQSQVFHLLSNSAISKPIDVTKNTESIGLIYSHDEEDPSFGRHKKETELIDSDKWLMDLYGSYKEFKTDFHKYPLIPGDMGYNNSVRAMFTSLSHILDANVLEGTLFGPLFGDEYEMYSVFRSLIPYVGTNGTIELIRKVLETNSLRFDPFSMQTIAIFPKYVKIYTEDLLKRMEILMDLKRSRSQQLKYTGIVCFAAMVGEAKLRAEVSDENLRDYSTKYYRHFKEAVKHEEKMIYLLGLINMGNLLNVDVMIKIINDKEESHHIRSLAAYGFKSYLSSSSENMFSMLWPIAKNQKEHFEVRAAVLDLLMSSDLTQEEFNVIIEHFKNNVDIKDPFEKHLKNYLATTLQSLQNTTMYNDYLGAMASDPDVNMTGYYDAWTTGNYRIAYTDAKPNFGSYFQARLVSNPVTNAINVIQLSYNHFAMSLDLGTYTVYIKLDGVADLLFVNSYLNDRPNYEIGIPQLIELLKKFNYKLIEDRDIHIEVVLFCDNRVLFSIYVNKDTMKHSGNQMYDYIPLLEFLTHYEFVTFPKMYMGDMRTDLGTRVATFNMETEIVSHNLTTNFRKNYDASTDVKSAELYYRSSRYTYIILESYNPLLDVNINVYKYKSKGHRVQMPISLNTTGQYLIFEKHEDSINLVLGRTIGMSVDNKEILATYCKFCEMDFELPVEPSTEKLEYLKNFNTVLNMTVTKGDNEPSLDNLLKYIDSYKRNSMAFELAGPVLLFFYELDYYRYLGPETGSLSLRNKVHYKEPTENLLKWDFDIDDIYDEYSPINGTELTAYLTLSCRKKQDASELGSIALKYAYTIAPVSYNTSTSTQIEQRHQLRVNYTNETAKYSMCFDHELQYPSRNANKLSISHPEPARGKGRFSMGTTNETFACSNYFSIAFFDIFESAENYMEKVENMKEYKTCKQDSIGFKYTPPTDACWKVHEAVQTYNNYTLYLDLKNAWLFSRLAMKLRMKDRGYKLFEVYMVHDDIAHFTVSRDLLKMYGVAWLPEGLQGLLDSDISLKLFHGVEKPTSVAYDDYDVIIGYSSTCDITTSKISTFTSKDIENYKSEDGKEIVAYVECFDRARGGMTIQKFSDKKLGFTMWSGNDTLVTSVAGNKLKVALNGEELHKQYTSEQNFKIYFLEDDVLYITNQFLEVYYNTEFISIKAPSLYNNYICGLCAYEDRRNIDNLVTNLVD
ncbi:crossveinless d [Carabus blaptoides fortunei]